MYKAKKMSSQEQKRLHYSSTMSALTKMKESYTEMLKETQGTYEKA